VEDIIIFCFHAQIFIDSPDDDGVREVPGWKMKNEEWKLLT